jgi:hypothetical protein
MMITDNYHYDDFDNNDDDEDEDNDDDDDNVRNVSPSISYHQHRRESKI